MDLTHSLWLVAPEEFLSVTGLILLLAAAWGGDKAARAIHTLAAIALGVATIMVLPVVSAGTGGAGTIAFGDQFRADAFGAFAKVLIYLCAAATVLVAPAFFKRYGGFRSEFAILMLFASVGMSIMVSATNLLSVYVGLEMNSLAAYVLAAFLRTDDRSSEAGLKYFVLGALASGILLFGISLVYGFTGSTEFVAISDAVSGTLAMGTIFGIVFIFTGIAFKISAVPFHMWTPDVYEGAPTPITLFFSSGAKAASLAMLVRIMYMAFGNQIEVWQQIVIFISIASILVGTFGAIGQENIKRLLAYSSINNVGFLLIGFASATAAGASAMLVYLAIYATMMVGGFVIVLMMRDENGNLVEGIRDLAGLAHTRPVLAWGLLIVMFSLAGIPPLFGFWGKFVVFQAAVEANLVVLAVIGIAASVISAFYYIKIVKIAFFDSPVDRIKGQSDWVHNAILVVTSVAISPLGFLLTRWLGDHADLAANALFQLT